MRVNWGAMKRAPSPARLPTLGLTLALTGCAAGSAAPAPMTAPPPTPTLTKVGDDYALPSAVVDLTSYVILRTDGGMQPPREMTISAAVDVLAGYDVVVFGEVHRHAGVHHAQMAVFRELYARHPAVSLSMEQFERNQQPVLDEYLAGKIGENTMASRIELWANYGTSYRPLVEFAKEHKLPVIAANAPAMVVRCVGIEGPQFLARMKPEQRGWAAAQLNLQDGAYKDKFMGFATGDAGHGGDPNAKAGEKRTPSEQAVRAFAAQVTRDDTMAESIAAHLQKNPGRKVVHLTGYFHSDSFLGTVERLKLRLPNVKVAVINPLENGDEAKPKITAAKAKSGTLLLVVRPLPEPYATTEEMRAAIKQQMAQRRENKCEL
jgi:uncharacterized iron-regulated protein